MSEDRKWPRSTRRASRASAVISSLRAVPCVRSNRSAISSLSLWMTGAMMCDGGSLSLICRMYSPRSVSTGWMPAAANARFRPISSDTIDLDFVTLRTPCLRAMSTTSRAASSRVSAYSTVAPRAVALRSKISSQTSSAASARLRRSTAAVRVPSKSVSSASARARAVTNLSASLDRFFCSRASASFASARALKCMACTCITRPPPAPARCAARACARRRYGAAGPRCSACSPDRRVPPRPRP